MMYPTADDVAVWASRHGWDDDGSDDHPTGTVTHYVHVTDVVTVTTIDVVFHDADGGTVDHAIFTDPDNRSWPIRRDDIEYTMSAVDA